jgi:surfeit locus 1 family protein
MWYWWDVKGMLAASGLPAELKPFPFAEQLVPAGSETAFPRPQAPRSDLANNHLGYAITWFGLAAALVGVVAAVLWQGRRR